MSEVTQRLTAAVADRYIIDRELGQGGMATVYLAHDVKHDRKVALKVLRPELAAVIGAERFLQEIKVTANLQHSYILPLYDSGAAGGFLYYVMPYVEGETLRTRLQREKQLGVDEAVGLARKVAGGLEHAHRQGVIHRDIKPENILLREGDPVIADFGIALAVSHAGGNRLTETGLSIGTPHYMSPEQAMGDRELDARSDVYSLGAMLFEMLTGDPPYTGSTAQAIVAKVITEKAPLVTTVRDTVPPHVAAAIQKALNKLPADRFHSAAEFATALATPGLVPLPDTRMGAAAPPGRPVRLRAALPWVLALLFAGFAGWLMLRPDPPRPVSRFGMLLGPDQGLAPARGTRIAVSPDGSRLLYIGPGEAGTRVWVRRRDELTATPLQGTDQASHVFFAPEGTRAGIILESQRIIVVSLGGGPPVMVADSGVGLDGATWSADGYIYYDGFTGGTTAGLARVPAGGGRAEIVTVVDTASGESDHIWPSALPGGRGVLFVVSRRGSRASDVAVFAAPGEPHRVLVRGVAGRYARSGHLVYLTADGSLMAVPFDLGRLEVTGDAVALASGVGLKAFGASDLALGDDGTLAYVSGSQVSDPSEIVWVTPGGDVEPVDPGWVGDFRTLAISPDGRRLAVSIIQGGEQQIWVKDLPRGPLTKLTFDGNLNYRPFWTPDGRDITFTSSVSTNSDLLTKRADGSAAPRVELDIELAVHEGQWARRGGWLVYRTAPRDIYARAPDGTSTPLVATGFEERAPALSPDDRWLAYSSDESGRYEVYVRPFPDAATAKWQVSTGGGTLPRWSPDGRVLYYQSPAELIAVQVVPGPTFAAGERRALFAIPFLGSREESSWDVAPDGRRFAMIRAREGSGAAELIIVQNFTAELQATLRR
jgi:eukaryotic-like serine/threonine-protein kinase